MNRSSFFNGKIIWLLLLAIAFALVACSGDKGKTSGGSEEETQGIAITDKTVAGVTQKGPFINGSSVTLFELNGVDLLQTGNSFVGKIKSDKGDFSISGINLVSPYALLEAKGYYRNEVTGKKSVSEIALNAVTNLENRDNVNVNLLTHLEYERVQGLVKKNVDIASAKEQAEKEIFTSFYVDEDAENFEDLNIFKSSEDDAVLLAISVLMQGERSEAELSELLANYSYDVESDGVWNDEEAKAEVADWAEMQTLSAGLENIRKNIEDWKLGSAPDFEKYVMRFWWYNYGLGLCDTKNEGSIKKNENGLSANADIRYICKNNFWYRYGEQSSSSEAATSSSSNEPELSSSSTEPEFSSSSKDDVSSSSVKIESSSGAVPESSSSLVSNPVPKQNWQYLNTEKDYGEFMDSRDNQIYKTITIGNQTWMAENLNYDVNHGDQSWCGGSDGEGCDTYGRLYTWAAAVGKTENECGFFSLCKLPEGIIQGVCPEGWHLPGNNEWNALFSSMNSAGTQSDATLFKSKFGLWNNVNEHYEDDFGFSMLPAGAYSGDYYLDVGDVAYFWTYKEGGSTVAYSYFFENKVYYNSMDKYYAFSVRCVKDALENAKIESSSGAVPESSSSLQVSSSSARSSSSVAYSSSNCSILDWDAAEDGTVRSEKITVLKYYVYDESEGWRLSTTKFDYELGVGGCTVKRNRQKVQVYNDDFEKNFTYVCYNKKWYTDFLVWNWELPKDIYLNDAIVYGSLTDTRDGKIYKTVQIGTQTWMAENLNYTDAQKTPSLQKGCWCYNKIEEYCNVTGALYTWAAAIDSVQLYKDLGLQCGSGRVCNLNQNPNGFPFSGVTEKIRGICPEGWHLPSMMEYEIMLDFVGPDAGFQNKNMMSNFGWTDEVDDEYGASFIPSGLRSDDGYFFDVGNFAMFWTSTIYEKSAYHLHIGGASTSLANNESIKEGFSVRCVKD